MLALCLPLLLLAYLLRCFRARNDILASIRASRERAIGSATQYTVSEMNQTLKIYSLKHNKTIHERAIPALKCGALVYITGIGRVCLAAWPLGPVVGWDCGLDCEEPTQLLLQNLKLTGVISFAGLCAHPRGGSHRVELRKRSPAVGPPT